MKITQLIFVFGFLLLVGIGCTKEEPQKQEYVRCLFNGVEWEDCCDCPNPWGGGNGQNIVCKYRPGSEDLTLITGDDCNGIEFYKSLNIRSQKAFSLFGGILPRGGEATDIACDCRFNFDIDTTENNFLLIDNYDIDSRIIEGTFEFTAIDPCGNIARITEGEFRVPFTP